jgi:hypothetical protein
MSLENKLSRRAAWKEMGAMALGAFGMTESAEAATVQEHLSVPRTAEDQAIVQLTVEQTPAPPAGYASVLGVRVSVARIGAERVFYAFYKDGPSQVPLTHVQTLSEGVEVRLPDLFPDETEPSDSV